MIVLTGITQTFRVYESGTSGPVCFFLHGGGYSGLSWAVLSVSVLLLSLSVMVILNVLKKSQLLLLLYQETKPISLLNNDRRFPVFEFIIMCCVDRPWLFSY